MSYNPMEEEILQDKGSDNGELMFTQWHNCPNCGCTIPEDWDHCESPECKKAWEDYLEDMAKRYPYKG